MLSSTSYPLKRWLPVGVWGLIIFILSLMPGGGGNLNLFGIPYFDKVGHFGMYAVWTFLFYNALSGNAKRTNRSSFWIAILLGAVTGINLEFAQQYMDQGRSYEVADMIANAVGAISGATTGLLYFGRKKD